MKQLAGEVNEIFEDKWVQALTKELEINEPCYQHAETDDRKEDCGLYDFKLRIWRAEKKDYWFFHVPQEPWPFEELPVSSIRNMKRARYRRTGRIFYRNDTAPSEFAHEYIFEGVE